MTYSWRRSGRHAPDETDLAGSREWGVDAPGGCPVAYNRFAAPSPSALTVGTTLGVSRARSPLGGASRRVWNLLEKAVCSIASAEKDGAAAAARDDNSETDVLSRGTDASGYGTAAGEELDCYTADGDDDGDEGSSSDSSESYVTRDGGTTNNLTSRPRLCCSKSESMITAAAGW